MGGAESAEMNSKQRTPGDTTTDSEEQVKTVGDRVTTTYTATTTTTVEKEVLVTNDEAVSEQKRSNAQEGKPHHEHDTDPNDTKKGSAVHTKTSGLSDSANQPILPSDVQSVRSTLDTSKIPGESVQTEMLMSPREQVEAEMLRKAIEGLLTVEEWIFPVVMARSNAEIALLKKIYEETYGEDLVQKYSVDLSGNFKKVVLTALRGEVAEFDASVHTSAKASADAVALYKAGEGMWGTDVDAFVRIIVLCPTSHLRAIDAAYSKMYQKTNITKAIKAEFRGDAQAALLFHVRMLLEPFEVLAELFESTMKGLGTDEYGLSAAVIRYYSFLPQIKTAYKKVYGRELSARIRGDTSGRYRKLLLEIVDGQ
ncbi:hypothetical protein PsorP6_011564 [Peronosclerospora sorghi]|uniref:Uncharacterized protein n=1 Tax=Peronosclerospora sorghi TaxID=230839 RepID=A0ACC0WJB6_9STRA|nr:hypothetical protein PsorP6_011564 [Peronosclerospora sorghi]